TDTTSYLEEQHYFTSLRLACHSSRQLENSSAMNTSAIPYRAVAVPSATATSTSGASQPRMLSTRSPIRESRVLQTTRVDGQLKPTSYHGTPTTQAQWKPQAAAYNVQ